MSRVFRAFVYIPVSSQFQRGNSCEAFKVSGRDLPVEVVDPAFSSISPYAIHFIWGFLFAGRVVDFLFSFNSRTVPHASGLSFFAGVTAVLTILLPGDLWAWNHTFLNRSCAAWHDRSKEAVVWYRNSKTPY